MLEILTCDITCGILTHTCGQETIQDPQASQECSLRLAAWHCHRLFHDHACARHAMSCRATVAWHRAHSFLRSWNFLRRANASWSAVSRMRLTSISFCKPARLSATSLGALSPSAEQATKPCSSAVSRQDHVHRLLRRVCVCACSQLHKGSFLHYCGSIPGSVSYATHPPPACRPRRPHSHWTSLAEAAWMSPGWASDPVQPPAVQPARECKVRTVSGAPMLQSSCSLAALRPVAVHCTSVCCFGATAGPGMPAQCCWGLTSSWVYRLLASELPTDIWLARPPPDSVESVLFPSPSCKGNRSR